MVRVLDKGELLYVAVSTRRGPHVTPAVFEFDGRRLWFVTPRRSIKARAIARSHVAGGLVRIGEWAVLLNGRARPVDPLTGRGISLGRVLDLPFASAGYLLRNHRHVSGIVKDRPASTLPLGSVGVVVDVTRLALLHARRVVASWGPWEHRELLLKGSPIPARPPALGELPARLRTLLTVPNGPVVVGWQSSTGPVALPGRWRGSKGLVETSAAAMALIGASSTSPACLIADRGDHRLRSKEGMLVMGPGSAHPDGETAWVTVEQERLTYWIGDEVQTVASDE